MIVHPGFGDLQKWILQVKYSLVAKEWVSDSKILKRQKKTHSALQSQTYPIVRIWTARATARGPHLCGDLYDVIGRLEVGVGTSSWCWGLMGLPKFDKLKFDNFPQNLKLEVTF